MEQMEIDFIPLWTWGHKKEFNIAFSVPFFQDIVRRKRFIAFRLFEGK